MTVASLDGRPVLAKVISESEADTPEAEAAALVIEQVEVVAIHDDLSAGIDMVSAKPLKAMDDLCSPGMKLHGQGFIVSAEKAKEWGYPEAVKPYRKGKEIVTRIRGNYVIDLFGLDEDQVRSAFKPIYDHLISHVYQERMVNNRPSYKRLWWIFGEPRGNLRPVMKGLSRYIATLETTENRIFQFLDGSIIPDNKIVVIASADAYHLAVLSSRYHVRWAIEAAKANLGKGNTPVYVKTVCFDTFPFPSTADEIKVPIRKLGEQIDRHRKEIHASTGVTLATMYTLIEKLETEGNLSEADKTLFERAQLATLRKLHKDLDQAVAAAYGWSPNISEDEALADLLELNAARCEEEQAGIVRWLRPEIRQTQPAAHSVALPIGPEVEKKPAKKIRAKVEPQPWPSARQTQIEAIRDLLYATDRPWAMEDVAAVFKGRGRYREGIQSCLMQMTVIGLLGITSTSHGLRWFRPEQQAV